MGLSYRHVISVLQLIVFVPCIFPSMFLVWRHGFSRSAGFIFLMIFSLARIVGAICDLLTISNPSSTGLYIAAAVCSSIGLGPLLLVCNGLLIRANDSIKRTKGHYISSHLFHLLRIIALLATILSIVALTRDTSFKALLEHPDPKIKVAMILYLVAWALLCLILALLTYHRSEMEAGEHRLLVAVGLSAVFIFVRLLYAILIWFAANSTFNFASGNDTVMLFMSVLEEFAVVIICIAIGLTLRVRKPVEDEVQVGPDWPRDVPAATEVPLIPKDRRNW